MTVTTVANVLLMEQTKLMEIINTQWMVCVSF